MLVVKVKAKPTEESNPNVPTGCIDVVGRPIFFGQKVIVKSRLTEFRVIQGTALPLLDGGDGFRIPYENGNLTWENDGTPCYECMALE